MSEHESVPALPNILSPWTVIVLIQFFLLLFWLLPEQIPPWIIGFLPCLVLGGVAICAMSAAGFASLFNDISTRQGR
jgi:hypothetical protein